MHGEERGFIWALAPNAVAEVLNDDRRFAGEQQQPVFRLKRVVVGKPIEVPAITIENLKVTQRIPNTCVDPLRSEEHDEDSFLPRTDRLDGAIDPARFIDCRRVDDCPCLARGRFALLWISHARSE